MRPFRIEYDNASDFDARLKEVRAVYDMYSNCSATFHITWANDGSTLDDITRVIEANFPESLYYGCEASGIIIGGSMAYGTIVTCSIFEKETSSAGMIWVEEGTEISTLDELWKCCAGQEGLRAVELISSNIYMNKLCIDGNEPNLDDILIFGGVSVNHSDLTKPSHIIGKNHKMTTEGLAAILYFGDELELSSSYVLGWKGLGRYMEVTDSSDKRITKIDNRPAYDIYENYLGLSVEENDTIVFPLIVEEDGVEFIRTPSMILPDKSIVTLVDIPQGSLVRIAYGDKNTILSSLHEKAKDIAKFRPEAMYVYSCTARKLFWGDSEVGKETAIFDDIAPVSGMYTGGEILKFGRRIRVLNATVCVIAVREGQIQEKNEVTIKDKSADKSLVSRLAYFIEKVTEEQNEARQKLIKLNEQIEQANRAKTDFLFSMSHDIRTPMNAIIGYTDLAKKHIGDDLRVCDCLEKIEMSGNHLLKLINEVLDMSRVEAGKLHSEQVCISIRHEADKLITICHETAAERDIELTSDMSGIIHDRVYADDLHVNQIVMNIIGNAIKYTLPGGRVDYRITELDSDRTEYGKYEFIISDNGIGMSKEFQKNIFDSFAREENETINGIQGTGLGMTIVKRLVDYLDGTIGIESEQGKGTTVTIGFYLKLTSAEDDMKQDADADKIDISGKRVLLVEDNELNSEIATEILKERGMVVEHAENGARAVEAVKSHESDYYDIILMDIQMPIMNGYEATKAIRSLYPQAGTPVIALSANAFAEDRKAAKDAGMNDHVSKPIDVQELFSCIAKYIKAER